MELTLSTKNRFNIPSQYHISRTEETHVIHTKCEDDETKPILLSNDMTSFKGYYLLAVCLIVLPILYTQYFSQNSQIKTINLLLHDFQVTIPIYIKYTGPKFYFPDLIEASQIQVDAESTRVFPHNWKLKLIDEDIVNTNDSTKPNGEYTLELIHQQEDSVGLASEELKAYLFYTLKSIHNNDLPYNLAQAVIYSLLAIEARTIESNSVDHIYLQVSTNSTNKDDIENILAKYRGLVTYSFNDNIDSDLYFTFKLTNNSDEWPMDSTNYAHDDSIEYSLVKLDTEIKQGLNIPVNENSDLHIASKKRLSTLKSWKRIAKELNLNYNVTLATQLTTLIQDVSNHPAGDWTDFLINTSSLVIV